MARYGGDFGGRGRGGDGGRGGRMPYGMDYMGGYAPVHPRGPYDRQPAATDGGAGGRSPGGPSRAPREQGGRASTALSVRAADIMTEDPHAVTPQTTLADAARLMAGLNVGIMPVVDGMESFLLLGVVTDRDLAVRGLARGKDGGAPVADCMTTEVATVQPMASVREVFDLMKREQVRRVPVTDRDGRLVGIIAQADLAVHYAGLDVEREREVEEVLERISEPGPRDRRGQAAR
jgi:CBS domain-containing protein